ncbi:TetR/AcrR family transcriptional regulator [Pseudomonas laurentiana]|uniref:TetR/AcrR family transcriptional regulator n=1 Tax=Pseudomonas laurentiana TaxID=2364649 RepID=A0A6I5RV07_9PSED|nr:TetR/AcrR family transcriptional regulator [Pseudomonas laurentiana]NES11261.1 TetR/AcrR family transcriptional regulator [Pseudomonas laurentiana]
MIKKRMGREEKQHITREKLFEAALELMVSKGFHAASVSDIAETAGFSKGAFFSNFSSKADLLLCLAQRFKGAEIERLSATVNASESAEALEHGLSLYIDSLKHNKACVIIDVELQLLAARDTTFAPHYHALHKQHSEALGVLIERIFNQAGKQVPLERSMLARVFTSLVEGLILQCHEDPAQEIKLVWSALMQSAPAL